jgi:hypothetical protein
MSPLCCPPAQPSISSRTSQVFSFPAHSLTVPATQICLGRLLSKSYFERLS